MGTTEETFRLINEVINADEVEQLKAAYEQSEQKLRSLIAAERAAGASASTMSSAVRAAASEYAQLRDKLDQALAAQTRLNSAARAGAKARLGLGAANIAQDVIQGGSPAYAVNNVLGMAGDKGIKALLGEGIQAAGGLGTIATVFGTITFAAGAAFLAIDQGLKSAKLGWGDLGSVVGNLAPINAAREAFEGFAESDFGSGLLGDLDAIGDGLAEVTNDIANWAIGWDDATAAAKAHKDELERGAKAARDYADAVKELGKYQSEEQKKKAETGKMMAQELANLGGEGGAEGLAARLAKAATTKGADDKIKVPVVSGKGDDGKDKIELKEMTRLEAATRALVVEFGKAGKGETDGIGNLAARLQQAGMDPSKLIEAAKGPDEEADYDFFRQEQANTAQAKLEEADREKEEKRKKKAQDDLEKEYQASEKEFRDDVQKASRKRSWMGKDPEELTWAEREAKQTDDERRAGRAVQKADADAMDAPGIKDFLRDSLLAGANAAALGGGLQSLGYSDEATRELLADANKSAYSKMLSDSEGQSTSSQTLGGGSALRDAIQGGVSNKEDYGQKQVERLDKAVSYLQTIAETRPNYTAIAG